MLWLKDFDARKDDGKAVQRSHMPRPQGKAVSVGRQIQEVMEKDLEETEIDT